MNSTQQPSAGAWQRWLSGHILVTSVACILAMPTMGTAQTKALNLLQQLVQPNQNTAPTPATPGLPAGLLGNALSGNAAAKGVGSAAAAVDLMGLLSQSTEQIDDTKEAEIGRQLAAVLLGSKPLHPDMALQHYVNQLGRWISLQSSRPELPWTFAVLDDAGYNAFAVPGAMSLSPKA